MERMIGILAITLASLTGTANAGLIWELPENDVRVYFQLTNLDNTVQNILSIESWSADGEKVDQEFGVLSTQSIPLVSKYMNWDFSEQLLTLVNNPFEQRMLDMTNAIGFSLKLSSIKSNPFSFTNSNSYTQPHLFNNFANEEWNINGFANVSINGATAIDSDVAVDVPEPASAALFLLAIGALVARKRRA